MLKRLWRRMFAVLLLLSCISSSGSADDRVFVLGGFDTFRGGAELSFQAGTFFNQARASLASNFTGASLTSFSTLDDTVLDGVDVLFISSAKGTAGAIDPLSAAEQTSLLNYVLGGGCAILLPDNDSFSVGAAAANESLIDPFSLDIAGTAERKVIATVTDPTASVLTDGPFGSVSTFSQWAAGGISDLGPSAVSLATNSLGHALAVIEQGALGVGSGAVVVYSDVNTFMDAAIFAFFPENENLFLNTIDFCITPRSPVALIEELIEDVIALNIEGGISNALDAKLDAALQALDDLNENNDVAAVNALQAFINAVEAQRGKKLTDSEADDLVAAAQDAINLILQ